MLTHGTDLQRRTFTVETDVCTMQWRSSSCCRGANAVQEQSKHFYLCKTNYYLSRKTASGGQYVPSLFFFSWKFTAVLMPTEASTAAINVVGTCSDTVLSLVSLSKAAGRLNLRE